MGQFKFLVLDVRNSSPQEWLRVWAGRYSSGDAPEYRELIERCPAFSAEDFERIGKWKDGVKTEPQWRPNVASVAYRIWMEAARELPKCPDEGEVRTFLDYWSGKAYTDEFTSKSVTKHFGPPRATTLLHFVSGGRFPIFDSRVRKAYARLNGSSMPPNTVEWYLNSYCPFFSELAALCECKADTSRILDKALFSYGSIETLSF
jgi:hypothetical protein